MEGWVKLHRKALQNGIIKDIIAWHIFTWLLLKVDRTTGIKVTGRFWAGEELGIKPITFYKGLKRLEKKWKMVTLRVTGKSTEISLINWHKYQDGNTSDNTSVTHEEHIGNTLQELRIKNKYISLSDLTEKDFQEISLYYKVPIAFVKSKFDDLTNYCGAKGKRYKNYRLALMDWVKKDSFKIREEVGKNARNISIDINKL